jgi:ATP:ADP antiporter, AAA family
MSRLVQEDQKFGRVREFFWPIYPNEFRKIIPLALILFFCCFIYSIIRNVKDAIVIPVQGAEVIPFLKVWAVLPMAVLLTYCFTRLSNRYSLEYIFYIMVSGFLSFFLLFAFVLYPASEALNLTSLASFLREKLPLGVHGLANMLECWHCTLFYCISELWSSAIITMLFWGFANEITSVKESRRFYAVLSVASNLAAIAAGQSANFFSQGSYLNPHLPYGSTGWEQSVMTLILVITFSGICAMLLFRWVNKNVLADSKFSTVHHSLDEERVQKKSKKRLSMRESMMTLVNNSYLRYIAVIVVSYNLVLTLVEVIWKNRIALLHTDQGSYNVFMNNLTSMVGCISTIVAFLLPVILKRLGWTRSALVTPVILLISGIAFFGFILFEDALSPYLMTYFGTSALAIAVFIGGMQNTFSKAMKYSMFDATKEMAFIPLTHEEKLKGKAAIDGVGSRFGKSGGSIIHQGLLLTVGPLAVTAPIIAAIFVLSGSLWVYSTVRLGKLFNARADSATEPKKKGSVTGEVQEQIT